MGIRRTVELRGELPRDLIDVVDAVAHARGVTRIDLVHEVLARWARARVHEANVIYRVTGGNPPLVESPGDHSD